MKNGAGQRGFEGWRAEKMLFQSSIPPDEKPYKISKQVAARLTSWCSSAPTSKSSRSADLPHNRELRAQ